MALLPIGMAVAQPAPPSPALAPINLMPTLIEIFMPVLGTLLIGVVTWGLRRWFGIQLNDRDVAVVNDALQKGIAYATARLSAVPLEVDVHSPVIREALTYALEHVPNALQRLGITPAQAAEKLVARYMDPSVPVGVTAPPVGAIAAGSPVPVPTA